MMKRTHLAICSFVLAFSFTAVSIPHSAHGAVKEVSYKNCTELNKAYKNGVSKAAGTKNKVVNQKTKQATYKTSKAYASASLYKLNTKLDNDKDGIACEK